MTLKTFVNGKIHGIHVTDKSVRYHGSVTIGKNFMREAGIEEYERVDVVNLMNGARWTTYAIAGPDDVFTLNGGGARLGEINDQCVIMTYGTSEAFERADIVYVGENNKITGYGAYTPDGLIVEERDHASS